MEIGRVLRVIINSFVFVLLLVIAFIVWRGNPLLSVVLLLSAIDQFEDVYYYVCRRRLFPRWFMPFDMVFETVALGVGLGIFVFSLIYYAYFETWFFRSLLILSVFIIYSAVEDMVMWVRSFSNKPTAPTPPTVAPATSMHVISGWCYVRKKEKKVRKEEGFVHRKH